MRTLLLIIPLLLTTLAATGTAAAQDADPTGLTWTHYYDQDQVTAALKTLNAKFPSMTELQSLGKSAEGRDIWCLTINNQATGPDTSKPAMYVDGAIHGNEIQATEVCLYTAWQLLTKYGEWEKITDLVDRVAFYIIPTVNVDNRARFFSDPGSYNIGRSARQPHDDDHDGLLDEDDYEDVDGDGHIMQMRIRDPHGNYRSHPEEPRVMQRVKPGEQGEWRRLGAEGIDNDGDGSVNEDPPGYLDMNRNWGFKWQPTYVQSGSGDFPFSAQNTKAISDFITTKPNIGFAFAFHNYGGMFLRGPGSKLSPPFPPSDIAVWDYLGAEGEKTVPGYRYLVSMEDLYTTHGDFDEYMYGCWGVYGFVGELYMGAQVAYRKQGETTESDEDPFTSRPSFKERQQFNDHLMLGEMFEEWRPFNHPIYGEIEIGGWRQFTVRMPPDWMLPDMLHRNAMFVIWTATQLPNLTLEVIEVKAMGDGLHRIRVRAANSGAIPTLSAMARNKQIYRLDTFTIEGRGIEVLSGGVLTDPHFNKVDAVDHRPWRIPTFVPQFGKREVQWLVSGSGKITVGLDTHKGGQHQVEMELE
jgi:hypothetical protein